MIHPAYQKEIEFTGNVKFGDNNEMTGKVQQWINLHKYHTPGWSVRITVDNDFGAITTKAVQAFQQAKDLPVTGDVDFATWEALISPMVKAFADIEPMANEKVKHLALRYMTQFLENHPTELPGNKGPWVRAFMRGHDDLGHNGEESYWCNGVISTAIDKACESLGVNMDEVIPWSWSVPLTVMNAKKEHSNAKFYSPDEVESNFTIVAPGDLLILFSGGKPFHIGMVKASVNEMDHIVSSLEGNSNDEGSANGYELCELFRKFKNGKIGLIKY